MPVRPENKARYPATWPAISAVTLQRADHRCQWPGCGAAHHAVGHWARVRGLLQWKPLSGNGPSDAAGQGLDWPSLQRLTWSEARQIASAQYWTDEPKHIVIVLTAAHLDHTPENCAPDNLRAWCQRHHLAYDSTHHTTTAYMTRMRRRSNLELPL